MTRDPKSQPNRGKSLLASLRQARPDASASAPQPETGDITLSLAQQTLLASQELHGDQAVGNITHCWDLHGRLDAPALERALVQLVDRHDALRMSIIREGGRPVARFAARLDIALPCETPSGADLLSRKQWVETQIETEDLTSLPLTGTRLWRARLFQLDEDHHVLMVVMHHLICDDWSWRILPRDLLAFYQGETGEPAPDLPRTGSFRTYLANLRNRADSGAPSPWPEIDWPVTHRGLSDRQVLQTEAVSDLLPASDFATLRQAARVHGCTPFAFFLTVYRLLLSHYCDQDALGISSSIADRSTRDTQHCIGALIRDIQVGSTLSEHAAFDDLLRDCSRSLRKVQNQPDDHITLGRATIGYYNAPELDVAGGTLAVSQRSAPSGVSAINLHLDLVPGQDGVRILFKGQRRHFDRQRLLALMTCFRHILAQVIRTPSMPLAKISLLSSEEAATQSARSITFSPLPEGKDAVTQFTEVAQRHPDAPAMETPDHSQSYAALEAQTNAWAHWLRARGLQEGDRIGVHAPRGTMVFKAWLGTLKAGLVVVPMDIDLTRPRIRDMLREARCKWVIGAATTREVIEAAGATLLTPPDDAALASVPTSPPERQNTDPRRDAFLMFTSGTTGAPKSIPICHQAVMRLALNTPHLPVGPGDRMIQLASPGFDGSFIELWGAWLNGATLVLCEKPVLAEGGLDVEFRQLAPTASFMTTSLFNVMVDANPGLLAPLTHLAIGGEAVSPSHCRRALIHNPDLVLSNVYGPTENTGLTTGYRISGGELGASVPIGRPLPNNIAMVLSRYLTPVPDGFAGELLVGGPGLARGYENRPDLSAERFLELDAKALALPLSGPVTLYRSGDRARWTPECQIEFMGRRDTQFKLHGYRIEPTELEGAIMEHPSISRAGVIPDIPPGQEQALGIIAYCEVSDDAPLDETALRAFLATRLPRPIRPTRYVQLAAIPLTRNGKTDTRALEALSRQAADTQATQPAAQDPLTAIWQRLLSRPDIPEDVDFYALGGTSLSLVRMVLEVEEQFEAELDFANFSAEPTLRRLRYLVSLSPDPSGAGLRHLRVLKQGDPALPAIILMPTATGAAAWAVDIASQMTTRHPVLAMSYEPEQGAPSDDTAPERMTLALLDDIRAHVGEAPVTLAGYSFGGSLAVRLATRAKSRGVTVARIINIDGGCPSNWVTPRDKATEAPGDLFDDHYRLQPCEPVALPFHMVTTSRSFPLSRADHAASWALLSKVDVNEHRFDTHHALLPKPPVATELAACLDQILAGTRRATRVLPAAFDPEGARLLNDIKALSRGDRPAVALALLDAEITARDAAPEWMVLGQIHLTRQIGEEDRLNRLRRALAAQDPSPTILNALVDRAGPLWLGLVRQSHASSGPDLSGAVPLVEHYLRSGQRAEAAAIMEQLDGSDRHRVEAAIARAVNVALSDGFLQASQQMAGFLSGAEVDHTHVRWCAVFLAKNGHVDAALDILELERTRFPGPMQKARAQIERRFRRPPAAGSAQGTKTPPALPAEVEPRGTAGRLKRALHRLRRG